MDVSQIRDGWEPVIQGLADTLRLLRDDCGVIIPKWLGTVQSLRCVRCAESEDVAGEERATGDSTPRRVSIAT